MSTAHRPTWDPAQAKEVKGGSRQYSVRDVASHTKLKFRQPGQTSTTEISRRDLRAELLAAEWDAHERKRKVNGLPATPLEEEKKVPALTAPKQDEEANKRRKALEEAIALDRDSDEDGEEEEDRRKRRKQSGKETGANGEKVTSENDVNGSNHDESSEGEKSGVENEDEEEDEEESEEEDDTAELLRELARIKRERQEEKERQEREQDTKAQLAREEQIATANPLLNLAAALGQRPGVDTTAKGTFAVKRRWDDDLIFKNQAMSAPDKPGGQFVNDLLRTEFHKKFMSKFIK